MLLTLVSGGTCTNSSNITRDLVQNYEKVPSSNPQFSPNKPKSFKRIEESSKNDEKTLKSAAGLSASALSKICHLLKSRSVETKTHIEFSVRRQFPAMGSSDDAQNDDSAVRSRSPTSRREIRRKGTSDVGLGSSRFPALLPRFSGAIKGWSRSDVVCNAASVVRQQARADGLISDQARFRRGSWSMVLGCSYGLICRRLSDGSRVQALQRSRSMRPIVHPMVNSAVSTQTVMVSSQALEQGFGSGADGTVGAAQSLSRRSRARLLV